MRQYWQSGLMIGGLVLLLFGTFVGAMLWQDERSSKADQQVARSLALDNRDAQLQACERGNNLRRKVNALVEVQTEFTVSAAEAREELARLATDPEVVAANTKAATRYRALSERIESVEIVDCVVAVPLPVNEGG